MFSLSWGCDEWPERVQRRCSHVRGSGKISRRPGVLILDRLTAPQSPPACGLRRNPTVVIFLERLTSELRYRSPLCTCGQFLDKRSYGVTIMTREPVELRSCGGAQKELDTRFLTIAAKVG